MNFEINDNKKDEIIFIVQKILNCKVNINEIKRFYNNNLERAYKSYYIKIDNAQYVLKCNDDIYEGLVYKKIIENKIENIPKFFGEYKYKNKFFLLLEYIPGDFLDGSNLELLIKAINNIANFHSKFWKRRVNNLKNNNISYELYFYIKKNNLISNLEKYMYKENQTLLHDDLILLNIIGTECKIIDWEYATYGNYGIDLGRFLGDLNPQNYKQWVREELEEILLKKYIEYMNSKNIILNIEQVKKDILYGKAINYVKILYTYEKKDLEKDNWYYANYNKLVNINNILK